MPPKTIASLLNNESNLRILEKLKTKPYYPRELAAEMKLSEPFLVRRLKAMEEYDIVEGRWENEGSRKVKRYYVKDITMQLGKDGLKVTSSTEVKTDSGDIDMRKELKRFLFRFPFILIMLYIIIFGDLMLLVVLLLYILWAVAINVAFYREYSHKNTLTAIIMITIGITSLAIMMGIKYARINLLIQSSETIGLIYMAVGLVFFMTFIYHIRFSQIEAKTLARDKRELVESLGSASVPKKIFYLPFVVRWKFGEYFGLL